MLVKEEYAEQYCRKRLKCTEDGGKCRTDASYSLYSGEIDTIVAQRPSPRI